MTSVDLDAQVARLRARIGQENGPVRRRVEAGAITKFALAIGETNPLYLDEDFAAGSRFGALIAPPTFLSRFCDPEILQDMFAFDLPLTLFLHTDDIVSYGRPIRAGDLLSVSARYADAWVKESRNGPLLFQAVDLTVEGEDGEHVATLRVKTAHFSKAQDE